MKDSWLLATSLSHVPQRIIALYGRRFTCEENFRDEKDPRFGLGSRLARVRDAARRDRLCFILAAAIAILTLLGAAGEKLGLDRLLRANTVKRRTPTRSFVRAASTSACSSRAGTAWPSSSAIFTVSSVDNRSPAPPSVRYEGILQLFHGIVIGDSRAS